MGRIFSEWSASYDVSGPETSWNVDTDQSNSPYMFSMYFILDLVAVTFPTPSCRASDRNPGNPGNRPKPGKLLLTYMGGL